MRATRARRAVVAGATILVVGGGAFGLTARASAPPRLPPISPERLVTSILQAVGKTPSVSGHVAVHVDLGIPQLLEGPLAAEQPGVAALLGDHRLRVWRSSEGFRVTELFPVGERSLLVDRSRRRAWAWDSESFMAYRLGIGIDHGDQERVAGGGPAGGTPFPFGAGDPIQAGRLVLDAVSPSTAIRIGANDTVAGRDAYVLVVQPRTDQTLVGRVEVAVDAEVRLPLSVRLFPRSGGDATLEVGFTDVRFGPVDPSVYAFTPPAGAKVREIPGGLGETAGAGQYLPSDVRSFGQGWSRIVALRVPDRALREAGDLSRMLPISGSVLSIRAVDRGDHVWIVVGAVPPTALAAVEPKLP